MARRWLRRRSRWERRCLRSSFAFTYGLYTAVWRYNPRMSLGLCIAATVAVAGLSDAEMRDVVAGKVPTRTEAFTNANGKSAGRGLGAIVIERPIGEVWATVARYDD